MKYQNIKISKYQNIKISKYQNKFTNIIFLFFVSITSFAQVSIGVKVGYGLSGISNPQNVIGFSNIKQDLGNGNFALLNIVSPENGLDYPVASTKEIVPNISTNRNNATFNYTFGLNVTNHFHKNFGYAIELNYSQIGSTLVINDINANTKLSQKLLLHYIQLPILFKIGVQKDNFSIHGVVGPYFSALVNGINTNTFEKIEENKPDITNGLIKNGTSTVHYYGDFPFLKDKIFNADMGLILGASFSYNLSEKALLFLDARYQFGFTNINNINYYGSEAYNSSKNIATTLTVGVSYIISKKE
ncbi:MAG: PorT family protein [Bacteroidetes bacterium]|nr:MAG: PorT family protein [Bacteroidota bacterium]